MFDVPVLLAVYNRADTAEKVLDAIAVVKPARFFIASNAPNPVKPGDQQKVAAVRLMIEKKIDWPCRIEKLYRTKHLGAGESLSSSMIWFFKEAGEGIVFEDDTLPDPSFFNYCKELLAYYRNDESVKMIGGNNFQNGKIRSDGSYYFSNLIHSWGYASWWRAWEDFDFKLERISDSRFEELLNKKFKKKDEKDYWRTIYHNLRARNYTTWDYQFLFTMWSKDGKCILPNKNLVTNIGFGNNATHTTDTADPAASIPLGQINNIIHPSSKEVSSEADRYVFLNIHQYGKWRRRFKRILSVFKSKGAAN